MDNVYDFFKKKKDWSKYKDLILDYYLQPYLQKVKQIGKPILVVDCCAGPERFDDGQPGSPLIITERLRKLHERNFRVSGFFIEAEKGLYERLEHSLGDTAVPASLRFGNFQDFVGEIAQLARTHTLFVYVDPLKPTDVFFNDLKPVYDQLKFGGSVETLINFMSPNFLRGVLAFRDSVIADGTLQANHSLVVRWNAIAGGTYWQQIAYDPLLSSDEQADKLADGYAANLRKWFKWVLTYPIREKYEHIWPKYHLIFGSRYPGAAELMNRAMVKARREFIREGFIEGHLFPNQPEKEVFNCDVVLRIVVETSRRVGRTTWSDLRLKSTIANPPLYTDSEFNNAIKRGIKEGKFGSDCDGARIEQKAYVWPVE